MTEFSSNTNPKWSVIVAFFYSLVEVWTEKFDVFSEINFRFQIPHVYCIAEGPNFSADGKHGVKEI